MEKLYKIYAITSILFLIVLLIPPIKHSLSEWRGWQKEFNQTVEKLPHSVETAPLEVQQIWARDLDRIDRCPTCHLSVENRDLKSVPKLFRPHPDVYHDAEKFGCTICHDGQGLATQFADAHLPSKFWDQPILPKRYLEASCGRCHINDNLKETPVLDQGRKLVQDLKCTACHVIPGVTSVATPSLDGIGSKIKSRQWLLQWLQNPKAVKSNTKMPHFFLSNDEAEKLVDFLLEFKTFPDSVQLQPLPAIYFQKRNDTDFIESGKTLFRESHCISCHAVNGQGGKLATDLGKVGSKAKETWLFNYLKNPKRFQPGVEMPQFGFSDEQFAAITAYLTHEFVDWDVPEDKEEHKSPSDHQAPGRVIFYKYNCVGCHALTQLKVVANPGPDLSAIGSKKVYQIYFGEAQIPHTLYDFLDTNLKTPRIFGESMRMPDYGLTWQDRVAITTYLLSLHDEDLPTRLIVNKTTQTVFMTQGKTGEIIQKYACLKCHTINGTGGTIAPDLSYVGSRLKEDWLKAFLKNPFSRRPLIEENMPKLHLGNKEIATLINYFFTVLLDDSLSIAQDWDDSSQAQERGRKLFWEKYGCQSCHLAKGQGGYLGPPLDQAGERLQPGWMLHWILNPQKYIPDTIEPRSGMSMSEAQDVVTYLMSL